MTIRNIHNWLVGIWFFYEIILKGLIPNSIIQNASLLSSLFGFILLIAGFYFLLFVRFEFKHKTKIKLKTLEEIFSDDNIGNYLQVLFIIFAINLSDFHPLGTWTFIGLYGVCLILIFILIFKGWNLESGNGPIIIIFHLFIAYNMIKSIKNIYAMHYGSEIIGSFFEKPNFTAKYFVRISKSSNSDKEYVFPALVNVVTRAKYITYGGKDITGSDDTKEKIIEEKYIFLTKVFFQSNINLIFNECELETGEKVLCTDHNGKDWYIQLTSEKVK